MSAVVSNPHLQVILEDDANRQIVVGFVNRGGFNPRLMPRGYPGKRLAGGWKKALEWFRDEEVPRLNRNPQRQVLIVIDFDEKQDRMEQALGYIPEPLRDRVYVVGCAKEPKDLVASMQCSKEKIGELLAEDCANGTRTTWNHPMLAHNAQELERLWANVRPFLFHG